VKRIATTRIPKQKLELKHKHDKMVYPGTGRHKEGMKGQERNQKAENI
jgi:hypothetical protein